MEGRALGGSVAFSHGEPCKVKRVTFYNGNAAAQGVALSEFDLASTTAPLLLYGAAGLTSQFEFSGHPFPSGFTVTPTDSSVTNVIVEYESMVQ